MNWKLIFSLSLFGLFMAFATVYFIPSGAEMICWLAIFLLCAYVISQKAGGSYFLHGFLVSLANCVWITGAHIALVTPYMAHHAAEAAQYDELKTKFGFTVAQSMLVMGPMIGVASGLVLGLFAFIASKMFRSKPAAM